MKKQLLFLVLIFYYGISSYSQCGETGTETIIESLDDLNELSDCDSIFGDLYISVFDISFLEALENLEYIEGDLFLDANVALLNVNDLSNLIYIGGNLILESNFTLLNIAGFANLEYLGGDLEIYGNWSLEDLQSFSSLTEIYGDLIIKQNNVLENINGLESVEVVHGSVLIDNSNIDLSDLSGLNGLQTVEGNIEILLEDLTSFNGFNQLETVGDSLIIKDFVVLANINGLRSLTQVGSLIIENNQNLVNVDSLHLLQTVENNLRVYNNQVLFLCCGIYPLLNSGTVGDSLLIADNSSDCSSIDIILEDCFIDNISENLSNRIQIQNHSTYYQIVGDFTHWELFSINGKLLQSSQELEIEKSWNGLGVLKIYSEREVFVFRLLGE